MKADNYKLKCERFHQGYTQAEVAKMAQISLGAYQKAEAGKDISPRTHRAILNALGLK